MATFYFTTTSYTDNGYLLYYFIPDANVTNLFIRQNIYSTQKDYYYPVPISNEGYIKLAIENYYGWNYLGERLEDVDTKTEILIGSKYTITGTHSNFSIPNTDNIYNPGKLWVTSTINYLGSYYLELGLGNRPNNYLGNHKILSSTYSAGLYYYSLDFDRQYIYSSESITARSITKLITSGFFVENTKYINYTYDKPLFIGGRNDTNRAVFKILNYNDTSKAGFLTNYKSRKSKYFSEVINCQIQPIWIYKADSTVVYDTFDYSQLYATVSGTMSTSKDGDLYVTSTFSTAFNGYKTNTSYHVNSGGLNYEYNVRTNNGVNDTITITNVESPLFDKPVNKPDYIILRYVNPYGVCDSLLLFCDIFRATDVARELNKSIDNYSYSPIGYGNIVSKIESVDRVSINNKYRVESDWLTTDEYNQFGEILTSKKVWLYDSKTEKDIQLSGGVNAEVKVTISLPQSGNFEFDTVSSLTINGITATFSITGIYYDFADDWMLAEVIPVLNASGLATNYEFEVINSMSIPAVLVKAKLPGSLFNIVSTSKTGQVFSFTDIVNGEDFLSYGYESLFTPILIEDSSFIYSNEDVDVEMKKLSFTYKFSNMIIN